MSTPNSETKPPAPPQSNNTNMKSEPKRTRLVKIKTVRAIRFKTEEGELEVQPDQVVEVEEAVAAEFCDRKFKSGFTFSGEMSAQNATKGQIVRAIRL